MAALGGQAPRHAAASAARGVIVLLLAIAIAARSQSDAPVAPAPAPAPAAGPVLLPRSSFAQRTKKFDTLYPAGSDDMPLDAPPLVRVVRGNEPEQIMLTMGDHGGVVVSWSSGEPTITANGSAPPHARPPTPGVVQWGTHRDRLKKTVRGGPPARYSQVYPDSVYTSGAWHHVLLDSLPVDERVYYRVGSPADGWSEVSSFVPPPHAGAPAYPLAFGVIADVGQTFNTTATLAHLDRALAASTAVPRGLLVLGDLAYADAYNQDGSPRLAGAPKLPYRPSYQPRWDAWGRMMSPLLSQLPAMAVPGNHEIEEDANGAKFQAYKTRIWHANHRGITPSTSSLWYSIDIGPVHFIMLNAYQPWNGLSDQLEWLKRDLNNVNRDKTPWLIVGMHPPWYTSFSAHYREAMCMKYAMEELLLKARVDLVFSGHVHGYERTWPVFDQSDQKEGGGPHAHCAPTYITVGDAGNIDRSWKFVDGYDPSSPDVPKPGSCPPADRADKCGRINYACPDSQPDWSVFRQSSYGYGMLELRSATEATWTWFAESGKEATPVDRVDLVQASACLATPRVDVAAGEDSLPAQGDFVAAQPTDELKVLVDAAEPVAVDGYGEPRAVDGIKAGGRRRLQAGGVLA